MLCLAIPLFFLCLSSVQFDLADATAGAVTKNGCICATDCHTSFDAATPWCETEEVNGSPCGAFSATRRLYWDECTLNTTLIEPDYYDNLSGKLSLLYLSLILTCWPDMWQTMTFVTVAFSAAVHGAIVLFHSLRHCSKHSNIRLLLAMPPVAAVWGGLHGLIFGAVSCTSMFLFMHLTPYCNCWLSCFCCLDVLANALRDIEVDRSSARRCARLFCCVLTTRSRVQSIRMKLQQKVAVGGERIIIQNTLKR